ncbi:AAA family ATPase [Streptomyces beijiangensis]|uniref:Nuclease SbcCD subunit C n=1 Tax=Streptomyces beijiangensis TaxID=163361 RepID=A0A939JG22_9ACTN|nr:SMC family ATPase [Streptomyces beijiangensis]MBO0511082.1 SMC family ATPase [Streptomyces beijiangensis]
MRLHSLHISAFGPFAAPQVVDFDALSSAGLFLLHGPTGAGKTSVLDAVCFALYGAVPGARQSPGATLRSDHAADAQLTEIRLELTVAGRRLEITRQPAQPRPKKRGTGYVTEKAQSGLREYDPQAGAWKALSRSHQEIGEEISQLVGMSREQFCQVVLLPQGDFARFLRADAEARGKLLGRLFDTRRFAAVEERLAELRRAAEQQVRAGDERLLTLAHRMAEAAGRAAAEWPLPDAQPGDPGLAESVLEWAAIARSGARERLDIASGAVQAAESRQAAARLALDAERELARLQQRYADTQRRAGELAARRPEYEQVRARLDRARKAERVAPALSLREQAEGAHGAASNGRERSRAQLPSALHDAGAEQLSALGRTLRQELGGLEAACRDERRSAEITADLAALEREARGDDELIQESAGWLSGWDTERSRLQDRIEAAREAGTLAEQLAGQLEPARGRLEAARERDRLESGAATAEDALRAARERASAAHESWLGLRERRLLGIAAELAAGLRDGEPCTVCGATAHPSPAQAGAGHVDRTAEEEAYARHTRAEEARAEEERRLAGVREAVAVARGEAGTATVAELAGLTGRLQQEYNEAHTVAAGTHAAREALDRAEREHARRVAAQQQAELRASGRTSRRETLEGERGALEKDLTRARGDAGSVAEHAALLERRVRLLEAAVDAVRAVETTAQQLKEADDRLADAAFRAGFDTPQAAAAELLPEDGHRRLQHQADAWQAEEAAVADRLAEEDAARAAELPQANPDTARAAFDRAERSVRESGSALDAARERGSALARLSRQAAEELRSLGPRREEYDRVARLAGLTAGTSTDNERRMRLESYVLAARLEQVAAAATVRLQRMSSGRYTLVHSDARAGGRSRSGLGLHVVDAWTGRERDTATLSGGETFFASLALALGLADVVTDEAGGIRLDTLFIDEGFGSLDEQTLDEVLDVLDSLRERDRSVGIVSHVADLRRRIPAQLEVIKNRAGSIVSQQGARD